MRVTIYLSNYHILGGVETFVNNFLKRMSKHLDLTLLYDNVDSFNLLLKASQFANVEKIDKSTIHKCDVFICASALGFEPYNNVEAKKYIQMIHADYTYYIKGWNFKYTKHKKVTHHVCVGQTVADAFKIATPHKADAIIYNLLDNEIKPVTKPKNDKLHLITLSRISGEKGFDRMLKLSELIPCDYVWHVWGNINSEYAKQIVRSFKKFPNVIFHGVTTEPYKEIEKADYLVQLSCSEGFCYSVYEAMQVKTPCLITPFSSGKEQIVDGDNGYILPFEVDNIDFDKIINKIPIVKDFVELGTEESWLEIINK